MEISPHTISNCVDKREFPSTRLSPTETIRVATRLSHNSLESTSIAQRLMSTDLNLLTYLKVLKVWVEAWSNLEEAILQSAFAEELQWMLPGSRSKLGITELNTLAVKYGFSAIQSDFVIKVSFQIAPSVGALVGTCYVMRGAELGGKIIGKHLHSTLALPDIVFTSFYTADNVEQKQWGAWQKKCNEFLNSQCLIFDAVSGAKDTYAFLINSFTRDISIS